MANLVVSFYEWLNGYFVNVSGFLASAIITVAFVFWGVEIFAWLERVYQRVVRRHYPKATVRTMPHIGSFIVFLVGALIVLPTLQGVANYLLSPLLRTTSLLVILVMVFMFFYIYYVHWYRPRLLR